METKVACPICPAYVAASIVTGRSAGRAFPASIVVAECCPLTHEQEEEVQDQAQRDWEREFRQGRIK